jgi:hypothetical protein
MIRDRTGLSNPPDGRRESKGDRDVFNERPTRDEQTVALAQQPEKVRPQATNATIHTSKGDIVRLSSLVADHRIVG